MNGLQSPIGALLVQNGSDVCSVWLEEAIDLADHVRVGANILRLVSRSGTVGGPSKPNVLEPRRGSGTILIINDKDVIRQAARAALKKSGFEVLSAENGQAGVIFSGLKADASLL